MLSRLGVELLDHKQPTRPVTMPALKLDNIDIEAVERAATAAKFLEARVIRIGAECWQSISKSGSFENWSRVSKALLVGKSFALRTSGASAPMGRGYSLAYSKWAQRHGLDGMPSATRSMAIQLGENIESITHWRSKLSERERKRLTHPQSIVNRWKAATAHNGKSPTDLRRDAKAAWARFCACARALPPSEARTLWQAVAAEATAHL